LLKEYAFMDNFGIIFEFLSEEVFNAFKVGSGQNEALSGLVNGNEPQVNKLLLFFFLVHLFEALNQSLKGSNHITKKSYSHHLN